MTGDLRVAGLTLSEINSSLNDHFAKIYVSEVNNFHAPLMPFLLYLGLSYLPWWPRKET